MAILVNTDGVGSWDKDDDVTAGGLPLISDETGDGKDDVNLTTALSSAVINGAIFQDAANLGSGTGGYNTFLALGDNSSNGANAEVPQNFFELGFNAGRNGGPDPTPEDSSNSEIDASKTHAILLGGLPIKYVADPITGVITAYYEFRVDLNESNSSPDTNISLDQFKIFTGAFDLNPTLPNPDPFAANNQFGANVDLVDTISELEGLSLRYDMDAGHDVSVLLSEANSSGSGRDDYSVLVPVSNFAGLDLATTYVYVMVQMGAADGNAGSATSPWSTQGGFEEWNIQNAVLIKGQKFLDLDDDGVYDGASENWTTAGGRPGVTVFIDDDLDGIVEDTDGDGILNSTEQSTVTDANGFFTFGGIPVTGSEYTVQIRELVPAGYELTTGLFETVTIGSNAAAGSVISLDSSGQALRIGNHPLTPYIYIDKIASVQGGTADVAGELITYTVKVSGAPIAGSGQTGPASEVPLTNVVVTDIFEGGAPVSLDNNGVLGAGVTVLKTGGDDDNILESGEVWAYTYTRQVTQAQINSNGDGAAAGDNGDGKLFNTATATSAQVGPVSDSAEVPIEQDPVLLITKTGITDGGEPDCIDAAGEKINWTIEVSRAGNVDIDNVVVTDDRGTPVYISGDDGDNVLEANETWTYKFSETVTQAMINANVDIVNTATANGEAVNSSTKAPEVSDDATLEVCEDPVLLITKTGITDGGEPDCIDAAGEKINWTIEVSRAGNVDIDNVVVTDDRGTPVYISGDDGDNVLEANETWTYKFSETVTQAMINANVDIVNTATANGEAVNSSTKAPEVSDDATLEVCEDPVLLITKTGITDGGEPDCIDAAGEKINWTIEVSRAGNVDIDNVVVTDDRGTPVYISGDDGDNVLEANETWTYKFSETVTQAMINANVDIVNTATANGEAVNSSTKAPEVSDDATLEVCEDPVLLITKTGITDGGEPDCIDAAGEKINWTIEVSRAGNVDIDNVVVTDDRGTPVYISGDDGDNVLEANETWTYKFSETVTQAMINANVDIVNTATANGEAVNSSTKAPEVSDDATLEVCEDPVLLITKTGITDGGEPDCIDAAGEKINWTIEVSRAGNVDIDNVVVTDDRGTPVYISGDDGDNVLEANETWTYKFSETVTQAMINANVDIVNTATANGEAVNSSTKAPEVSDDATIEVCQNPAIDVEKSVRTNLFGFQPEDADDEPGGLQAATNSKVDFKVVVSNIGNVTLSNITFSDTVQHTVNGMVTSQAIAYTNGDAFDVFLDLNDDGIRAIDGTEDWINFDTDGDGDIDAPAYAELAPGDSYTLYYSLNSALGQHENRAEVTGSAATSGTKVTDADDANYYVLASDDCVGVGTPGFWSNNGAAFWDGIVRNEKHIGNPFEDGDSDPGFADGELLYAVDADGDGTVEQSEQIDSNDDGFVNLFAKDGINDTKPLDNAANVGLLIGDYNGNGITDAGEDTIFISLADAKSLINASNRNVSGGNADGVWMVGRDVVATWLNYLANGGQEGDCFGDASNPYSPTTYLDAAIDWMQQFSSTSNADDTAANDTNLNTNFHDSISQARFEFDPKIATNSTSWQSAFKLGEDILYSGSAIHTALDNYNNTGTIWDPTVDNGDDAPDGAFVEYCCDRDNPLALQAISMVQNPSVMGAMEDSGALVVMI
jgi:hypothetical protein